VYGIITQSGGTIGVESTPGRGTVFTVAFPAIVETVAAAEGDVDEDAELPRGTETILVVDDEQPVLDFVTRTLKRCGYSVLAARGPLEALSLPDAARPVEVLITDVLMPNLSGPQLVTRYVARHPAPAVIYMTGYVDDATMDLELDQEVVMLRKPFGALDLARAVRAVLDGRAVTTQGHHA
jgi:two-component system, cell cycle sensor histidine kinase and response regulator CckA